MALFIRQDENRSEIQNKIATELQERSKNKARQDELPDGVEDSEFVKDIKPSKTATWVWVIVALVIVGLVLWLIISSL